MMNTIQLILLQSMRMQKKLFVNLLEQVMALHLSMNQQILNGIIMMMLLLLAYQKTKFGVNLLSEKMVISLQKLMLYIFLTIAILRLFRRLKPMRYMKQGLVILITIVRIVTVMMQILLLLLFLIKLMGKKFLKKNIMINLPMSRQNFRNIWKLS